MRLPFFGDMLRRHRRERIAVLLQRVEAWEQEGLDLFAQLEELTDPSEALGQECRRVQELLAG